MSKWEAHLETIQGPQPHYTCPEGSRRVRHSLSRKTSSLCGSQALCVSYTCFYHGEGVHNQNPNSLHGEREADGERKQKHTPLPLVTITIKLHSLYLPSSVSLDVLQGTLDLKKNLFLSVLTYRVRQVARSWSAVVSSRWSECFQVRSLQSPKTQGSACVDWSSPAIWWL